MSGPEGFENFSQPAAPEMVEQQATGTQRSGIMDRFRNRKLAALASIGGLLPVAGGGALAVVASGEGLGGGTATAAEARTATPGETSTVVIVNRSAHADAFQVASKRIVIGENDNIKIDQKTANQCIETKPGQPWTNSVRLANGSLYTYTETTPAKLCRDKYSPLGWVKRGGGKTGLDCRNAAAPQVVPQAHKNVEVLNVSKLNVTFTLIAKDFLKQSVECPGVKGSGTVSGEVKQHVNLRNYLKMTGAGQRKFDLHLVDQASVKAHLNLSCSSTETTVSSTTPATTETQTTTTTVPTTTTETTTTTTPTVPTPSPANLSVVRVQEVDTNGTDVLEADVSNATTGDQYETCFTPDLGRMDQQCIDTNAPGTSFKVLDKYTAPSDPGTETLSVTAKDLTLNLVANNSPFTQSFPIQTGNPSGGRP